MSLDRLLSLEVRLTLRSGVEHTGQVFTVVDELHVVVLATKPAPTKTDFIVVNTAEIAKINILRSDLPVLQSELPTYSPSVAAVLEPRSDLQRICEEIGKTYKYAVDGAVLRLVDLGVAIHPPYVAPDSIAGAGVSRDALDRVARVVTRRQLSETRIKLQLDAPRASLR